VFISGFANEYVGLMDECLCCNCTSHVICYLCYIHNGCKVHGNNILQTSS
jgi:hypothetical protein